MNIKLITEIETIKKNMGLISEAFSPLVDDLLRLVYNVYRRNSSKLSNEEKRHFDELSNAYKKGIKPNLSNQEINYVIKKALESPVTKYELEKSIYKLFKESPTGKKYINILYDKINLGVEKGWAKQDIEYYIGQKLDNAFHAKNGQELFPGAESVMNKLKQELYQDIYVKTVKGKFSKGFRENLSDKVTPKMQLDRIKDIFHKIGSIFRNIKGFKWISEYKDKIPEMDREMINKWFWMGLPDSPRVIQTFRQFGFRYASGVAIRQLIQKYFWLLLWTSLANFVGAIIKPFFIKGEKLKEDDIITLKKGTMGEGEIVLKKFLNSVDFLQPAKFVSPFWSLCLAGVDVLFATSYANEKILLKRIIKFLIKDDEREIQLSLGDLYNLSIAVSDKLSKGIEDLQRELENAFLDTEKTPIVPDNTKTEIVVKDIKPKDTIKPATGAPIPDFEKILGGK
jgi:hypothetical protein